MAIPESVLKWLLSSDEPSVRYGALVHLLDEPSDSTRAKRTRAAIRRSPRALALLAGQQEDGGFGLHTYQKFGGVHWRLLRLAELIYPPGEKAVRRALASALPWALSLKGELIAGRWRRCATQQGVAIHYCLRLGHDDPAPVRTLVERLLEWQWPDGGWNCDCRPEADHSSFHESVWPMYGLAAYWQATGDKAARAGAERMGELLLRHGLFRSDHDPEHRVMDREFLKLSYPYYWQYNILEGLRALALVGKLGDPRAFEALDLIEAKRRPDGTWAPERAYWKLHHNTKLTRTEIVPWTKVGQPDKFLTLRALSVLKAAGRIQ